MGLFSRAKPPTPMVPAAPPFFQWVNVAYSTEANAMVNAFESERLAWKPMIGPAIGARSYFRSISPAPANMQAVATAWLTGLGGIQHGQLALQPLSNPYSGG